MPDTSNATATNSTSPAPSTTPADVPVDTPDSPASTPAAAPSTAPSQNELYAEVAGKISEAHNVLIALSSDPSVDEMATAIGLSLYLDKLGKRATAIYSGSTPNALEFLKPEETFESTADTLQDFVIALNKDKADHLRYKLDGDFVKIFITPYKNRISEDDLEFSYGDFNVDLVLALDVVNGIDLDAALREHGRIMHNAVIINITTSNPGKFGEIEWSDKSASSVAEMVVKLIYSANSKVKIEKEEATAFLTGIVAATNRFSNAKTTSDTMKVASRLMESGANQQLISKNITPDVENELFSFTSSTPAKRDTDPTNLDIKHGEAADAEASELPNDSTVDAQIAEKDSSLLADLKAAEASLANAGAETTPDDSRQPIRLDSAPSSAAALSADATTGPAVSAPEPAPAPLPSPDLPPATDAPVLPPVEPAPESDSVSESSAPIIPTAEPSPVASSPLEQSSDGTPKPEKVIQPSADFGSSTFEDSADRYGKMLEDALADVSASPAPTEPYDATSSAMPAINPALMSAPPVAAAPEINGVPEINYMPMPGEEILPPPPAPPIDMDAPAESAMPVSPSPVTPIEPAAPVVEPAPDSLGSQPAMQDQIYAPQASDPSAFKIPGM